jgi:hypothetical protein
MKKSFKKNTREGLPNGPNEIKTTQSGFIISERGQWDFPGLPTMIPSNNITMKNVPYPVFGFDDLGYSQMMYPGMDYKFPGNQVYELPIAQVGKENKVPSYEDLYKEYNIVQSQVNDYLRNNKGREEERNYRLRLNDTANKLIEQGIDVREEGYIPDHIKNSPEFRADCISGTCRILNEIGEPTKYYSNTLLQDDVIAGKVPGRTFDYSVKGIVPGDILQFKSDEKSYPFHAYLIQDISEPDAKGNRTVKVAGSSGNGPLRNEIYILTPDNKITDTWGNPRYVQTIRRERFDKNPVPNDLLKRRDELKSNLEKYYPNAFKNFDVDTDAFKPTAFIRNNNNKLNLGNPGFPSETINLDESKLDEILTQFSDPDFKSNFMKQQKVSNDEYDAIVKNVIGIYGAESKFGTGYGREPLWLQKFLAGPKGIQSVGPFQINPKMLKTKRFSRNDLFDPILGSEAAAIFLAENLPLLRNRAGLKPGDDHYSENLNKDNYLEYIPYLMNQQGLLLGDNYTEEEKPGRIARFFGADPTPTPENKLTGDSEYNQAVKRYIENLGVQAIPASMSNPVTISDYQDGGIFNPNTDEFIGFVDELPKAQDGEETKAKPITNIDLAPIEITAKRTIWDKLKGFARQFPGVDFDEYQRSKALQEKYQNAWFPESPKNLQFIEQRALEDGKSAYRPSTLQFNPITGEIMPASGRIDPDDTFDLALLPASLPFKATSRLGKIGLGAIEMVNPISGFRNLFPTYKNIYRIEPTSWSKDPTDALSGRWFGELEEMPFYVKNLKDKDAGYRIMRKKVSEKKWKKISGENMPDEAKKMSIGPGKYGTYDNASKSGELSQAQARRLTLGAHIPSDVEHASLNKNLINLNEGILPEEVVSKIRLGNPRKFLSSSGKVEYPAGELGKEGATDHVFHLLYQQFKNQGYEKPILGIPRKYFPFKNGGLYNSYMYQVGGPKDDDDKKRVLVTPNGLVAPTLNTFEVIEERTPLQKIYDEEFQKRLNADKAFQEKWYPGQEYDPTNIEKRAVMAANDKVSKYIINQRNKEGKTRNSYANRQEFLKALTDEEKKYIGQSNLAGYLEPDAGSRFRAAWHNINHLGQGFLNTDPDLTQEEANNISRWNAFAPLGVPLNALRATLTGDNIGEAFKGETSRPWMSADEQPLASGMESTVPYLNTVGDVGMDPLNFSGMGIGQGLSKVLNPFNKFKRLNPNITSSVDNVGKGLTQASKRAWQMEELPGLHLKSTMEGEAISKIVEPKTGLINTEQALAIIGKESGGADKVALIRKGLGDKIPKKMDFNEFRKITQEQLIPLERQFSTQSSNYGIDRIGYPGATDVEANIDGTFNIFGNPTKFKTREEAEEFLKLQLPLENQTLILGNKSKFGRGSHAHGNPEETLGHVHFLRDAETPDVLTVTQIQSDAFQGTYRIMPKDSKNLTALEKQQKSLARMEELQERNKAILNKMKTEGVDEAGLPVLDYQLRQFEDIVKAQENTNIFKKADIENFTQKQLLDKNHQERYLQELVDYAGKRGDVNKVRVPTSETAAKVQGYNPIQESTLGPVTKKQLDESSTFEEFLTLKKEQIGNYKLNNEELNTFKKIYNDYKAGKLGKVYDPAHTTILKKYSEQPKTIKKLFGKEPTIVTDSKGNTWYEFDIPEKFKKGKGEIKAFGLAPYIGLGGAGALGAGALQQNNQSKKQSKGGNIYANGGLVKAQIGIQTMRPDATSVNMNLPQIDLSKKLKLTEENKKRIQELFPDKKQALEELESLYYNAYEDFGSRFNKLNTWPELSGKTINLTTDRYRGANIPIEYLNMLTDSAKRFKLDPYLLYAIAGRESTFGQGKNNEGRNVSPINLVSGWNIDEPYRPYSYERFLADKNSPNIIKSKSSSGLFFHTPEKENELNELNNYIIENNLFDEYKNKISKSPKLQYTNPFDLVSEFIVNKGIEKYNPGDPDYKNKINKEIELLRSDPEFTKYYNSMNKKFGGSLEKYHNPNKYGGSIYKNGGTYNPNTDEIIGFID